ncbi:MAG: hypothetical protein FWG51_03650 [Firmicutes bacterium]|nr:hypothetical protein [Bacillota bacterium]
MKKFVVISFSLFLFSVCCINTAKVSYADQSINSEIVLRVTKDDIYFYSSQDFKDSDRFFKLTKTYFLIGADVGNSYCVRYKSDTAMELRGYVKKSDVEVYSDPRPNLIYPEIFAICQGILSFYLNAGDTVPKFSERVTNLDCYGIITHDNNEYILIYYSGSFNSGLFYVNYKDVSYTKPAIHPIPIKSSAVGENNNEKGDDETQPAESNSNVNEIIQIVIIAAVVIFALLVVYLMFRPGNLKYNKPKE